MFVASFERDGEGAALVELGLYGDVAIVQFDEFVGKIEADARAAAFAPFRRKGFRSGLNRCGRRSGGMPLPVSAITMSIWLVLFFMVMVMAPPSGVNLKAFDSRLKSTESIFGVSISSVGILSAISS